MHLVHAREVVALGVGLLTIGLVTTAYVAVLHVTNPTVVALSFLLVVLVQATMSTRRVAIATSLVAFGCFNYFFLPPLGTFVVGEPQHWVALLAFLVVSTVASHLSSEARRRAVEATARRDELGRLFELTRDVLLITDKENAADLVAACIARRFTLSSVVICLPDSGGWRLHTAGDATLPGNMAVLDGITAPTTIARSTLIPLNIGTRQIGILAFESEELEPGVRDAIAGVTAIAIERTHLLETAREAELARRSAELKSALVASLRHDLRTPLTAVTVAANNLNASWLSDEQRREQAAIVRLELDRLNRLFQDMEDLARIEIDALDAETEWVQPAEIIEAAARQAEGALATHALEIDSVEGPFVRLDPRLTSAAIAHLLENAGQYSAPGAAIHVRVTLSSHELQIAIRDHGVGIAAHDLEHLFERFYRGADARQTRLGTGMGLAITEGLVLAQGGRVWAENHADGGAVFTMAVPVEIRTAEALEAEAL